MNPIDYFVSYYGADSWKDVTITWGGSASTYTLYEVNNATPLYTGAGLSYTVATSPSTRGDYRLEASSGGINYQYSIMTYTTALPAPIGFGTSSIGINQALLTWTTVNAVNGYEIADVTESYEVVATIAGGGTTWNATSLNPSTRYSFAVRSVYGDHRSKWSSPVTFFTNAPATVTPGVYEFSAANIYVWTSGKAGSSDPQWLPASSHWYAGDGTTWGVNTGTNTTYFFYGSPNQFGSISGGTVTKLEIYLDRNGPGGDPGIVLSRWNLHRYANKPGAEPTELIGSTDIGQFARGQAGWIELPTAWGEQLVAGTYASGVAWGGTPERFQSALNTDYAVSPRTGNLKITVA